MEAIGADRLAELLSSRFKGELTFRGKVSEHFSRRDGVHLDYEACGSFRLQGYPCRTMTAYVLSSPDVGLGDRSHFRFIVPAGAQVLCSYRGKEKKGPLIVVPLRSTLHSFLHIEPDPFGRILY